MVEVVSNPGQVLEDFDVFKEGVVEQFGLIPHGLFRGTEDAHGQLLVCQFRGGSLQINTGSCQ